MKICIIANGYPDDHEPQWGCFERDQAFALKAIGHDVGIIYVDKRFRKYWRRIGFRCSHEDGIVVFGLFLLPTQWIRRVFGDRVQYWLSSRMLNAVFKKYETNSGKPDILYAHYLNNIAYAAYIRSKKNIPLVGIEHWSVLTQDWLSSLQMRRGTIGYNKADRLLSVSKSLQNHIKKHFGKESIVVYDMLGQEFVTMTERKYEVESTDSNFRFVSIGSLIPRKGFDVLLLAFAKSRLPEKRCRLIIVGDGPEKEHLMELAEQQGISKYVSLVGRKTKKEIISILRGCHSFVLSSRAETFGVVCIEALSQGLPNIATICGGPEEFIDESNGVLIPTDDVDAMSTAMIKMYNDYNKYDINTIAEDCRRKFAPQVIAQQLTTIFEEVIKK